jgi:hypothetical protein
MLGGARYQPGRGSGAERHDDIHKQEVCRDFSGRYWARTSDPSLSTRSSVRVSSLMFAQSAWLSGISRRANA